MSFEQSPSFIETPIAEQERIVEAETQHVNVEQGSRLGQWWEAHSDGVRSMLQKVVIYSTVTMGSLVAVGCGSKESSTATSTNQETRQTETPQAQQTESLQSGRHATWREQAQHDKERIMKIKDSLIQEKMFDNEPAMIRKAYLRDFTDLAIKKGVLKPEDLGSGLTISLQDHTINGVVVPMTPDELKDMDEALHYNPNALTAERKAELRKNLIQTGQIHDDSQPLPRHLEFSNDNSSPSPAKDQSHQAEGSGGSKGNDYNRHINDW